MSDAHALPLARRRRMLKTDPASIEVLGDPFRPLEPECRVLQFDQPLTPTQLQMAGELIASRPDVQLYVYGRACRDLNFLEWFPDVRRLHVALYELEDVKGFGCIGAGIEEFTFGRTKKRFSLRFLESSRQLKQLFVVGHGKDLAVSGELPAVTRLGISGITLPDLSIFKPLRGLRSLSIFLGATHDLRLLPEFGELEKLFLMRITRLSDLGVLADLRRLADLRLDWMRNVTSLPSFAGLRQLADVTLDTMLGLSDLRPVAEAPALTRLSVVNMPQLAAADFACLRGHPTLAELSAYTGKAKVNAAVRDMFPGFAR